ncbi:MAG: hypothetical protein JXB62_18025 [Pirellulales bacterium]|nr:hypothetical protein [Pirellulales bacterium]
MNPKSRPGLLVSLFLGAWVGGSALLAADVDGTDGQTATEPFSVAVRVDANSPRGKLRPIWRFFGADEPNYAYMPNGRKLLARLGRIGPPPVYFRAHNLLNSGDGAPALKWGSTGVYREDAEGRPVYDWTLLDRIFDAYLAHGVKPYAQIGFMPKDLSVRPEPYQHRWRPGAPYGEIYTGWAYPPKDYRRWAALVHEWTRHCVKRYGRREVASWYWETWNEPNIGYWQAAPEEFRKLHDYAVDAVRRALPEARVGGPDVAGSGGRFLRDFLDHCLRGENHATGDQGTPLDFVSFHAKGAPQHVDGHVRMGIANQLRTIEEGFRIVASYPELKDTPIVIGESDPEGCAACQGPQLAYRNGTMYSSYTAASFTRKLDLAERHRVNLLGALTWAFEFEGQPYFAGFRSLATNGIDKPVLNVFRMFGKMSGRRLAVHSDGAVPLDTMLREGVRARPDVSALASRDGNRLCVLLWHYHDDDLPGPAAAVSLTVEGLESSAPVPRVDHYRVDQEHSNAFAVWKRLGSPQQPGPDIYAQLEEAGGLQTCRHTRLLGCDHGTLALELRLPRQAVSLLVLDWGDVTAESPSPDAQTDSSGPVSEKGRLAPKPLYRDPVYDGAADPTVIWNRHRRQWWMFYTNRRANVPKLPGVSWVHGTRIGIAASADGGVSWHYLGEADIELPPRFGGQQATHWAPEVVTGPNGTHHMFLSVVPGVFADWDHPRWIVHLTSTDLRHWKYHSVLELASDRVIDACVLRLPDGTWRMWYNNERDRKSIYFADSPDLMTWQDRGKAVGDQAGEGPTVLRWRDRYWMITDVWSGLAAYSSDDALTWTRQPGNLLEKPGRGADDQVKGGHPGVVVSGDRPFLFYFTHPGRRGPDERKDGYQQRRSSIQVVELGESDGRLTCDRDQPVDIRLLPVAARN